MTYDPVKPRYTLPFDGKDYELLGTFELIEAAEAALQTDILKIGSEVIDMPVGKSARLMAALLTASGHKVTALEIGRTLTEKLGVTSEAYALIKIHLYAAIRIFVAPPADREAVAKEMGELIGKLPASPGESIRNSPSVS